jgi:hypothetical protein
LARYLLQADFTTEELMLDYGTLIPTVKKALKAPMSQEVEEYPVILQDWMLTHAFKELDDLKELRELREEEGLDEINSKRLSELEEREPFLLDFTGQTQAASSSSTAGLKEAGGMSKNKSKRTKTKKRGRRISKRRCRTHRNKKKSRKQFK